MKSFTDEKKLVDRILRNIIFSEKLISPKTKKPLSESEEKEYYSRALFYLSKDEAYWQLEEFRSVTYMKLAPAYEVIILLWQMSSANKWGTLKSVIEAICQTSPEDESLYQDWLKVEENGRLAKEGAYSKVFGNTEISQGIVLRILVMIASILDEDSISIYQMVQKISVAFDIFFDCYPMITKLTKAVILTTVLIHCPAFSWQLGKPLVITKYSQNLERSTMSTKLEPVPVGGGGSATVGLLVTTATLYPFFGKHAALLAGTVAAIAAVNLAKNIIQEVFRFSEDETLIKAYSTLNCTHRSTDDQVAYSYSIWSSNYRPRNGRNASEIETEMNSKMFFKIQAAYRLISTFRDQKANNTDKAKAKEAFEKLDFTSGEAAKGKEIMEIILVTKIFNILRTHQHSYRVSSISDGLLPFAIKFFEEKEKKEEKFPEKVDDDEPEEGYDSPWMGEYYRNRK